MMNSYLGNLLQSSIEYKVIWQHGNQIFTLEYKAIWQHGYEICEMCVQRYNTKYLASIRKNTII